MFQGQEQGLSEHKRKTSFDRLSYLPSIAQRHHVINVNIRSQCPRRPIIRTVPSATDRGAGRILDHIGPIPLQHHFSRVACPGLGNPMGEEVAAVAALAAHRGDANDSKLTARGGAGGNTGWSGCWDGVGIRGEYGEEERKKDKRRLHDDDCLCFCFWHGKICGALRSEEGLNVGPRTGYRLRDIFVRGNAEQPFVLFHAKRYSAEATENVMALWSNETGVYTLFRQVQILGGCAANTASRRTHV
jgi:hypothetical protein